MRSRRRGLSLVETLVAAELAGMLFALIASLLAPVLQTMRQTIARVEMEEEAAVALLRVDSDMRLTSVSSPLVVSAAGSLLLGLTRAADVTPGTLVTSWEKQVIVYTWDATSQTVTRAIFDASGAPLLLDGSQPARLTPTILTTLNQGVPLGRQRQVLARGVPTFSMTPGTAPNVWTLSISLHREPDQNYTGTLTCGGRN